MFSVCYVWKWDCISVIDVFGVCMFMCWFDLRCEGDMSVLLVYVIFILCEVVFVDFILFLLYVMDCVICMCEGDYI